MYRVRSGFLFLGLAAAAAGFSAPASADAVADFYKDKRITVVVGFGAGGGYGLYAQTIGPFISKYLPGKPDVVPQFMPGVGSLKAANYVYNAGPKDGTYFAVVAPTLVVQQVTEPQGMKIDHNKVQYIGRMNQMNTVFMVNSGRGIAGLDDAKKREVILASTGKGDQSYMYPMMANRLVGTKFKIVLGYKGSKDMQMAMERNEAEGRGGAWASWKSAFSEQIASGKFVPLFQIGLAKAEDLPKLPLLQDLVADADDKAAVEFLSAGAEIGRTIWAPAGMPKDRVAAVRTAFDKAMKDPEFMAGAKKRKMDLEYLSGANVQKVVARTLTVTPKQVARANEPIK
jgi:tripartite-type tricarboxylate transporter receptor subunit TctC